MRLLPTGLRFLDLVFRKGLSMLNSIPQDQNSELHIRQLKAQRSLYSRSKALRGLQVLLAIPIALGWSVAASFFPKLQIWATLWGISVTLLDTCVIDNFQESCRKTAATIQELFDCEVLRIEWNESLAGPEPAPEIVSKHSRSNRGSLENWYPVAVGDLPLDAARIICQRSNLSWDADLRRIYNGLILALLIIVVAVALVIGLFNGMTLQNFVLAILAPLSPSIHWVIKEYRAQRRAAEASDQLRSRADRLWRELLSGTVENPIRQSRCLQDELFENRRSNPAIFDWLYNILRKRHEERMNYAAVELVRQFQSKS